jgi:hypothetical protein
MAIMVAARANASFEFFAQHRQKSFVAATQATNRDTNSAPTKKPALIAQVRAVKYLKN